MHHTHTCTHIHATYMYVPHMYPPLFTPTHVCVCMTHIMYMHAHTTPHSYTLAYTPHTYACTHRYTCHMCAHIHHIPFESSAPLLLMTCGGVQAPYPCAASRCPALWEDKMSQGHSGYINKMTFKLVMKWRLIKTSPVVKIDGRWSWMIQKSCKELFRCSLFHIVDILKSCPLGRWWYRRDILSHSTSY